MLPFATAEDLEAFLATARILEARPITGTASHPIRLTLEQSGVRMQGVFRHIDVFRHRAETPGGLRLNFRDCYIFEVAAYRLSRLLGIDHVPPAVRRDLSASDFAGHRDMEQFPSLRGSVQAWVEGAMTEGGRKARNLLPRGGRDWTRQFQTMWLFDNLIFNDDRNQGNILIQEDWDLWFIDATRAFRPIRWLPDPDLIVSCEEKVWEHLQSVSDEQIRKELDGLTTTSELECLLIRRAALVEKIQALIKKRGRTIVLFSRPGPLQPQAEKAE